jgi:hypothetical protein
MCYSNFAISKCVPGEKETVPSSFALEVSCLRNLPFRAAGSSHQQSQDKTYCCHLFHFPPSSLTKKKKESRGDRAVGGQRKEEIPTAATLYYAAWVRS